MTDFLIAPSILAANFARLGEEVDNVLEAGADIVHFDVMDNHYVPNLTIGQATYEANCITVTKALENFQNEVADYSTHNQESFWQRSTLYNSGDTITLDDIKASNPKNWAMNDYELGVLHRLVMSVRVCNGWFVRRS